MCLEGFFLLLKVQNNVTCNIVENLGTSNRRLQCEMLFNDVDVVTVDFIVPNSNLWVGQGVSLPPVQPGISVAFTRSRSFPLSFLFI